LEQRSLNKGKALAIVASSADEASPSSFR